MSSKRHIRRKGCVTKVRHATHDAALEHLRSLQRHGVGGALNVYRCLFCKGWHVGHRPNQHPSMRRGRRS